MSSNNKPTSSISGSNTSSTSAKAKPLYSKQQPPTMVSVVEEQSNDTNMVHILPLGPASRDMTNSTINSTSDLLTNNNPNLIPDLTTHLNSESKLKEDALKRSEISDQLSDSYFIKHPNISSDDKKRLEKIDLLHKKSSNLDSSNLNSVNTLSNPNLTEMKLKKTTNPSISNLRATSQGNYPTVSSTSTTLTKGSTRAEYFAAKLHDAIKGDQKNQNEAIETFVYGTTTKTPPIDQSLENNDNLLNKSNKDTDKFKSVNSAILDSHNQNNNNNEHNRYREKLQSVFRPDSSPISHKTLEDNFETKSRSSSGSKKHSRKRSSKNLLNHIDAPDIQPLAKLDNDQKSVNQLRQITSRLFDSKLVQPRRYSNIETEFVNDDSFEGDMDYYEPTMSNNPLLHDINNQGNFVSNYNYNKNNINHDGLENNSYAYSVNQNDSDYEDELSNYFNTSYNPSYNHDRNRSQNINYLNKQQIHGDMLTDYGSIQGDHKRQWRKRNDIYNSPHDFTSIRAQRLKQIRGFCYTVSFIFCLLFLGFVSGFILATNKELQAVKAIELNNAIVSQEELVFDILFSAFNPGLMPITIDTVQFDIFAKTQYLYDRELLNNEFSGESYETILLGTIEALDLPLYFEGGFINRKKDTSKTEIRILNPCSYDHKHDNKGDSDGDDESRDEGDDSNVGDQDYAIETKNTISGDNTDSISYINSFSPISHTPDPRWLNISRNPFDLIIRGAMKYKLPFSSENHTASISYTGYIDPGLSFTDV